MAEGWACREVAIDTVILPNVADPISSRIPIDVTALKIRDLVIGHGVNGIPRLTISNDGIPEPAPGGFPEGQTEVPVTIEGAIVHRGEDIVNAVDRTTRGWGMIFSENTTEEDACSGILEKDTSSVTAARVS